MSYDHLLKFVSPFQELAFMGMKATIAQAAPNRPPTLSEGDLDPAILWEWFIKCETYLRHKGTCDADMVKTIAYGMVGVRAIRWLAAKGPALASMGWEEYKSQMRALFLASDWEHVTRMDILRFRQSSSKPFIDFALELMGKNNLLAGTDSFMDDDFMRETIEAGMEQELSRECNRENANHIEDFQRWLDEVKRIDDRRRARLEELAREFAKLSVRQTPSTRLPVLRNPVASNSARSSTTFTPMPRLTDAERKLLLDNGGCYKCRRFWANHIAPRCTNPPLDGAAYKTLTASDVPPRPSNYRGGLARSAVAALLPANPPDLPPSSISDVNDNAINDEPVVSAVLPNVASCVVDTDSPDFSDEEYAPFVCPNIFWSCSLSSSSDVSVRCLIDDGSSAVLIKQAVVDRLKLRTFTASSPFACSSAFSGSSQVHSLSSYVKLRPRSTDGLFLSTPLRAFVAPSLVTDVILGLPFLQSNRLVLDHGCITCTTTLANDHQYDLLHPSSPLSKPPAAWRRSHVKASEIRAARRRARPAVANVLLGQEMATKLDARLRRHPSRDARGDCAEGVIAALRGRIEEINSVATLQEQLKRMDGEMKKEYAELFPDDIPAVHHLPDQVFHRFRLKDAEKVVSRREYSCPKKLRDVFKVLLDGHLAAGRIRPSDSEYASPAFLIPKADPTALPRWVNDYRALNENTIADRFPLPRIDDILADCGRGQFWGKLDMTNAFFQTKVHPDDIKYTAVRTPFGLYEWVVMPQGCRNAPSTHQRRMVAALRHLIGKICHVYLDDIIIWSSTLAEHIRNVRAVLDALREASLYCSLKKTSLFCIELDFLGHRISRDGIQADANKALKISQWPQPRTATDVRQFLGLVRYLAAFLPGLASLTAVLTPLTNKANGKDPVTWLPAHQKAFEDIKCLVASRECLTVIDHDNPGANKIFVTTDASDLGTGAVLSFGPDWKTARPVAFESKQLNDAEKNYPTHDKEMLAIVRALRKWRTDLLGASFEVHTDHRTLEFFNRQRDLSKKQLRWSEFLADYDFVIKYVRGEDNTVADALSREFNTETPAASPLVCASLLSHSDFSSPHVVAPVLTISADKDLLDQIKGGYANDAWCQKLLAKGIGLAGVSMRSGLLYVGDRLVVPRVTKVRETLFRLAHDALGHFGCDKTYLSLRDSFYWPNMKRDLEDAYIPGCVDCQRNKSPTSKPAGPLHSLAVPDNRLSCVALDFVGPLPPDEGFDYLLTITDRLGADIRLIPCHKNISAERCAALFFEHWYCENGLPTEIVSDRDKLFVSKFWSNLHKLTGIKVKLSSAFHPQTDGSSERTNKTVIQALRYYVDRDQLGWVKALPHVRFCIMNTVNASTGFSPFQLRLGMCPRVVPPLVEGQRGNDTSAAEIMEKMEEITAAAQDSLLFAKISQSLNSLSARSPETPFNVGDSVYLSTSNRRREYMHSGENRVAKFMPRFDGPYKVIGANPARSSYTLHMPNAPNTFPVFHSSLLRKCVANNVDLFPSRELERPGAVLVGEDEEWMVDRIVDEKKGRRGLEYLVRYKGYGAEEDRWLPRRDIEDLAALDVWLASRPTPRNLGKVSRCAVAALLDVLDSITTPPSPMLLS